jgi:putative nucleotidyltransferase with HDIG domain
MDKIDRYLDQVRSLPPAPTVAIQLLELFSDPDCDIDQIVEMIKHDPALTAETLRCCNSAGQAGGEPTSDMFEAVCHLGLYEVYTIVTGLIASKTMTSVQVKHGWDSTRLWRHTVTTAVIASILAKRAGVHEASAFTAGLLHDVGKLIFVSQEGAAYAELARAAEFSGPKLVAAEEGLMGFSHASLGARLLSRWDLPESVCLAVQLHHQLSATAPRHKRLVASVNFANCLAHQLVDGPGVALNATEANLEAMGMVELKNEDLPALMEEIQKGLERVQGLMKMKV